MTTRRVAVRGRTVTLADAGQGLPVMPHGYRDGRRTQRMSTLPSSESAMQAANTPS